MRFDIEAIEQRVQLLPSQGDRCTITLLRPVETMLLKTLVVKTEAIRLPEQNLDPVTLPIGEHKQLLAEGAELQRLFDDRGEAVDGLPEVNRCLVQVNPGQGQARTHCACPADLATSAHRYRAGTQ